MRSRAAATLAFAFGSKRAFRSIHLLHVFWVDSSLRTLERRRPAREALAVHLRQARVDLEVILRLRGGLPAAGRAVGRRRQRGVDAGRPVDLVAEIPAGDGVAIPPTGINQRMSGLALPSLRPLQLKTKAGSALYE